jgi:phosphohistidine swiveling domain-containing protein
VVEGEVVVLRSPEEIGRVRPDAILVTPIIGPNWTAVFGAARRLIVEMAGVLSHGAILARECGNPAVAGVPGATQLFRDGERVRVDGSTGTLAPAAEDGEATAFSGEREISRTLSNFPASHGVRSASI